MASKTCLALLLTGVIAASGCSFSRIATNKLGEALASGTSVYSTDDDPELVREALPFGLKTIEGLLANSPEHPGLLLSATSGFTQYAYAYLQSEADFIEESDLARATALRERAAKMYRRALGYGQRSLEVGHPGILAALRRDPKGALAGFTKQDVPRLYWTAMAWGAAISINKQDAELSADLPLTEALMRRALELDESFGLGSIYDYFISFEGGRPAAGGGSVERARQALAKARQLAGGHRAAPLVSFAETVSIGAQDKAEFEQMLTEALAIDPNAVPDQRLANLIAQKRARWLLARKDILFIE